MAKQLKLITNQSILHLKTHLHESHSIRLNKNVCSVYKYYYQKRYCSCLDFPFLFPDCGDTGYYRDNIKLESTKSLLRSPFPLSYIKLESTSLFRSPLPSFLTAMILDIATGNSIHVMSDPEGNKTDWFPKGPDIKCFVIFLDFHFNSNQRITGANQNSRLGTYNNTNLILKTTE